MKLKIDDVAFWILILAAFIILLWLLRDSPTIESVLVAVGLFIMSSIIFLYRKYFEIDKNTAVGFMKVKSDFKEVKSRLDVMGGKLTNITNKLSDIEKFIKNKK